MSAKAKTGEQPVTETAMPKPNLFQRLNAVMLEVDYIQKEKKAGMRYSIVTHDAVTAKVRPVLVRHGVLYFPSNLDISQNGNRTEVQMFVSFVNIDNPEDRITVATAGYGIDDQDKGPGKAISYAVKYALLKVLGLESGDDPDEDQTTTHTSAVFTALKTTIDMASTVEELMQQVGPQISGKAPEMSPAEVAQLRSYFAQRKAQLAK